ncbi:isocitrate/isopropylmalate dehydrogenase family protein [Bordetella genomosp. 9]|uniref:3-isopropylmalate dehydrogenase n=1 Tax=Bordetella genomosp. 9 TaxID=1416803 RepID=A0A1W6Z0R6_9BORD|nr:isocitrate/isopropylmalate dehydrogenase family protein [Bordetella genomosp. 9]ARP86831.1 3-isopropylmalate dehydrogenase [Bordetella genomosp. 9]ARP90817.1 3-isopropylmalate dehydrogenase [Bordetella genomosp. 9]
MKIVVLPGDGIGPETMAVAVDVLQAVDRRFGLGLQLDHDVAGHESLKRHGATVTPALLEKVRAADGLMLGPMSTYDFKDEAKGEINPSMFFRKKLDLYANIRPARTYPGIPARLGEFDLVVVRENTEGFYADRNVESGGSEMLITPDVVVSLRRITRLCCERIARSAFELAMTRKKHVTIVHKANVLKLGDGMFIEECRKVAQAFPEVRVDDVIVDAMMAHVVRAPDRYDVVVTTNMFGDILSDLTAEISGSLGLAGSLNAGRDHAMGQAAHGSAPDIAGRNIANPASQVLSAAMLLNWYGQRQGKQAFVDAASAIDKALADAVAARECTQDVGGTLGTREAGAALVRRIV